MPRMIWKGAISFGLVHVPVQLYPATQSEKVGFNLLDKRTAWAAARPSVLPPRARTRRGAGVAPREDLRLG
jgi:non-homologous end joining protein Ku